MRVRKKIIALVIVSIFFGVFVIAKPLQHTQPQRMTITMLNVGQGDSFYIRFADASDMLIDAGPGERVLSELSAVMPWWDHHIDTIVLTHPDSDHIAGFSAVLERYSVTRAFDCGMRDKDTRTAEKVYAAIEAQAIALRSVHAGDELVMSSGEYISILSPSIEESQDLSDTNACSIVFSIIDGNARALFTGDAPIAIEQQLLATHLQQVNVDLLKIGHHGSNTSSSREFLEATSPDIAIISSGLRNSYHHPHPSVVQRLRSLGIPFLNTAVDGRVRCQSTAEDFVCTH